LIVDQSHSVIKKKVHLESIMLSGWCQKKL
jgi:hypothetical protein